MAKERDNPILVGKIVLFSRITPDFAIIILGSGIIGGSIRLIIPTWTIVDATTTTVAGILSFIMLMGFVIYTIKKDIFND